jgi:hypothetical protein
MAIKPEESSSSVLDNDLEGCDDVVKSTVSCEDSSHRPNGYYYASYYTYVYRRIIVAPLHYVSIHSNYDSPLRAQ